MSPLTQEHRFISIKTPLPADELLLTSFEGTEYISDLFEFQIEVLSRNHSIKPEQLIAKEITLSIQNDQNRTFHGFVSRFTYGEIKSDNLRIYNLTMVPWLWFLSKTNNHRIFQEMKVEDIVSSIFRDYGFGDYEFRLEGNYVTREYCVQHNESDLNFVSRLLEEEGIAYFFMQQDGRHVMQLVDAASSYQEFPESYLTYSKGNQPDTQINQWRHVYEFRKGHWSLNDYDFKTPKKDQFQTTASTSNFANAGEYKHYEYTPYHDFSGLKELTKKRIEAEETPMNIVEGSSDCSSFYAGGMFKLGEHTVSDELGTYIVTAIRHRAHDNSYLSGNESGADYGNDFACIPNTVHYRPPLVHAKPVIQGPQSALVVGAAGEEIYVDKDGRIKVQFHWDTIGKKDEGSTCFIRVMQPWAGAGWGTSFIPRIGMEVVVNFFNGDPDRPIITGSVYNGDNKPPFNSKTQSGIKTRSTKGGTASNCNELRFDDNKDSEQIFIHAEHNMDTEVENNETLRVDVNRTKKIGKNETYTIGEDRDKTIGKNQTETIGENKDTTVGKNYTESIGDDKTLSIGKNHSEDIGDDMSITIGKNLAEQVGKNYNCEVGKSLVFNAGDEIILKTGSASITMKKNGEITIKGKDIKIQGSGKVDVKASSNLTLKGSKVSTN